MQAWNFKLCVVGARGKVRVVMAVEIAFGTCNPNSVIFAAKPAYRRPTVVAMTAVSMCCTQSFVFGP